MASCLVLLGMLSGCAREKREAGPQRRTIVVTYSVLGAAVKEVVGDAFDVNVLIPDGLDLHAWEPSARDIEALSKADLIVENGLGLEHGIRKAIEQAQAGGAKVFTIADHVPVRTIQEGELPEEGHGHDGAAAGGEAHAHQEGAPDPHFWTDPLTIETAMKALGTQLRNDFGVDVSARVEAFSQKLQALDAEVRRKVDTLPAPHRKLVTGHESLGYFAQRYGFKLVGAVIPGLSTEAQSSAAHLEHLRKQVQAEGVSTLFTEAGTPEPTVEMLRREAGVRVVVLSTHRLPADGSYSSFVRTLSDEIIKGLQ